MKTIEKTTLIPRVEETKNFAADDDDDEKRAFASRV